MQKGVFIPEIPSILPRMGREKPVDYKTTISRPQLAALLRVTRQTIYNYEALGMPVIRMPGRHPIYNINEVKYWIREHKTHGKKLSLEF